MYTIHQLSEMLKVNSNAIRFYEKKGLIYPKRSENGYRTLMTTTSADCSQSWRIERWGSLLTSSRDF